MKSTSFHTIEFVVHNVSRSYGKTNEGIEIEDQIWFITVKGTPGTLGTLGTRWSDREAPEERYVSSNNHAFGFFLKLHRSDI